MPEASEGVSEVEVVARAEVAHTRVVDVLEPTAGEGGALKQLSP